MPQGGALSECRVVHFPAAVSTLWAFQYFTSDASDDIGKYDEKVDDLNGFSPLYPWDSIRSVISNCA